MDPLINHNNSSASPRQKTRFVVNKGIVESRRSYLQRHDATNINLSFIIPCLSLYLSTYHSQSVCLLFFLFVSPFFHSLNCHCFVLSSQHFNILSIHIDVLLTLNLFLHINLFLDFFSYFLSFFNSSSRGHTAWPLCANQPHLHSKDGECPRPRSVLLRISRSHDLSASDIEINTK